MHTTKVNTSLFLASFLLGGNAFGFDFNAHLFQFDKSTYSLVQESEKKLSLRAEDTENKTANYHTHSFAWNIQLGYAGKNEVSESVFFDQSGKPLFVQPRKKTDPYENKTLQHFLQSKEKDGVNFQLVYLFPYFHVEGKQYSLKVAQVGSVTAMRYELRF
jgi:hypothetical protein